MSRAGNEAKGSGRDRLVGQYFIDDVIALHYFIADGTVEGAKWHWFADRTRRVLIIPRNEISREVRKWGVPPGQDLVTQRESADPLVISAFSTFDDDSREIYMQVMSAPDPDLNYEVAVICITAPPADQDYRIEIEDLSS